MTITAALHRHATKLVALALVGTLYGFARQPVPGAAEQAALAARFRFTAAPLPEPPGRTAAGVRAVHPSLARIASWISSVGAGIAVADLDGDGLPNDACHVDPRFDEAIVAPLPGTGARFPLFTLDPAPELPYDRRTTAPMGCVIGDLNEDGLVDLLVYYWGRTPVAFLRRAGPAETADDGRQHAAGLAASRYRAVEIVPRRERWYTNAATRADVDGDGHADLVFGNYFPDGARILDARAAGGETMQDSMSRAADGGRNRLLLWAAGGGGERPSVAFADASAALPQPATGWTLAVGAADLDGDLLPELYVANDFGSDELLHNRSRPGRPALVRLYGERRLTTPASKVLGHDSFKGMGVDFADLSGDGLLDLYVSNIAQDFALEESHFVFVSTGETARMREGVAPYVDRSEPLGLARSAWSWDGRLADFDNDGVLEAVQATGFVRGDVNRWPELHELAMGNDRLLHLPRSWPRMQPGDGLSGDSAPGFFARSRSGRYVDLAPRVGLGRRQVTRGIAVADVDGDGALDLALANQWEPSFLYRNRGRTAAAAPFLGLRLLLPLSPAPGAHLPGLAVPPLQVRTAVGATAAVRLGDGRRLVAEVDGGSGHSGDRSPELHFGLGALPPAGRVEVTLRWRDPSGRRRTTTRTLPPGWHTLLLGWTDPEES